MSRGKLFFKYGCMGSGKSLDLIAKAYNFEERGLNVLVMKSAVDDRDGLGVIHSRAIGNRNCEVIYENTNIFDYVTEYIYFKNDGIGFYKLNWLLIDECQFLSEEQMDQIAMVVDYYGVNAICYGLRTDFKTRLFPASKRLFELADTIEEVKSTCDCGQKPIINARVDKEGNILTEGEQIEVGGDDRYVAYCRSCYNNKLGVFKEIENKLTKFKRKETWQKGKVKA